jgi:hypothetical protein
MDTRLSTSQAQLYDATSTRATSTFVKAARLLACVLARLRQQDASRRRESMRTQHLLPTAAALALTSAAAFAQSSKQPETPVTLVGCIQKEADYRKTHDLGKGGTAGTGVGRSDEYVLINASRGSTASPNIDCSFQGQTEAYELTGRREHDLAPYVGKVVQISGTMKEARTKPLPSGEPSPTGGFDPLKKDLRLFEVEVSSFQAPAGVAASAAPAPSPVETPRAEAQPPAPGEPPRQIARADTELPRTASPVPLAGLAGILSLAGALGARLLRRR